jgi:hypothetical protein
VGSSMEGVNKFQSGERASPEDSRFGSGLRNIPEEGINKTFNFFGIPPCGISG